LRFNPVITSCPSSRSRNMILRAWNNHTTYNNWWCIISEDEKIVMRT
jgi:hypothetical protein